MDLTSLLDPVSAAVVAGGTTLATVLRCGIGNCRQAAVALVQLGQKGFDAEGTRAEMAVQVQEIQQDGILRAKPHRFVDREFDEAADALIGGRSVKALIAAHEAHKARRTDAARRAATTLAQASELAPVFGLAGTLVSLSQLPAAGIESGAYTGAISMAVLTTLYGLLLANFVLAPLARLVERAAAAEELERDRIIDWLAWQIDRSLPRQRSMPVEPVDEAA